MALFFASVIAIGLFYGPALFYGEHTHISVMEYWRWWVVHLWVEGFFEVFSVAALSFIFVSLGLVSRRTATVATITEAALFLIGGIPWYVPPPILRRCNYTNYRSRCVILCT